MREDRKHTPLPYSYTGNSWRYTTIYAATGQPVMQSDVSWYGELDHDGNNERLEDRQTKDAKFIVRARNSHYELLEALKRSNKQFNELKEYIHKWNPNDVRTTSCQINIEANQAAIAKAEEKDCV